MKIRLLKSVLALFLTFAVLCSVSLTAFAAQTASIGLSAKAEENGEITVKLQLTASDKKAIAFSGYSFSIFYDAQAVSYVQGSEVYGLSSLKGEADVYKYSDGRINAVWYGDEVSIPSSTALFTFKLKVNSGYTGSSTSVKVKFSAFYTHSFDDGQVVWKDIPFSDYESSVNVALSGAVITPEVQQVIDKINEIGTVSYNNESLERITAAASAYALLSESQKAQVSNYSLLKEAKETYDELKAKAKNDALQEKVEAFEAKWKDVLDLTVSTVQVSDAEAVKNCYEAFQGLDADVKYEIFKYNQQLKALLTQIDLLKNEAAAAEQEQLLRAEAQQYAVEFKQDYIDWISMKQEDVQANHYNGLSAALETLNTLLSINPYVEEYLSAEKILLESLLEKSEELKTATGDEEDINEVAAAKFRRNFSYLISLEKNDVTYDEVTDLTIAIEVYKMLDSNVQKLLSEEYDKLNEILSYAETLEPESESESQKEVTTVIQSDPETIVKTNTVVKSTGSNLLMQFANRSFGVIILALLPLMLISVIMFAALQIFYHYYFKKRLNQANLIGEEDENLWN